MLISPYPNAIRISHHRLIVALLIASRKFRCLCLRVHAMARMVQRLVVDVPRCCDLEVIVELGGKHRLVVVIVKDLTICLLLLGSIYLCPD